MPDARPSSIEIPGIGTVRRLSREEWSKLRRGRAGADQARVLARALGVPTKRFNRMPEKDRETVRFAYQAMTSPTAI